MAGTSTARICVLLATFVVLLSSFTQIANTLDLPYSKEDNDVMDMSGGSADIWQRRTVDILLEALMLLRDEMDTPSGDDVQQVVKKAKNHYLFWRSPVFRSGTRSEESARKRSN